MNASFKSPAPPKTSITREEWVEISVDIDDFDDDVILEAARKICAARGIADISGCTPAELAEDVYIAMIEGDSRRERDNIRELVGTLTGRIL